jgi:hypothetical protein
MRWEPKGTLSSAWDQHLVSVFAAKSADSELATMQADRANPEDSPILCFPTQLRRNEAGRS